MLESVELITTHLGADFDAFASALAARRLHPGADVFFPGSQEESVRRVVEVGLVPFKELRQRDIDPAALSRVILCDSRRRDRLGVVAEWLGGREEEIEILAYDHHEASASDLPVSGGLVDPAVGSTSTLMVEIFRCQGLGVAPAEATLLLMGIYEDTLSLTGATTCPRDLTAVLWLLEQGGDLGAVRRFALPSLDPLRLDVLYRMSESLTVHAIHDHRIGVTEVELGEYIEELAPLVNRCLEIFDLPVLFALFGEGTGVSLIGRGQIPGLDLGEALRPFGGGGHQTAASARVKGVTTLELRERLLGLLADIVPPAALARDLMIRDFFCLPAGTTVAAAKGELLARRVNAAPVSDGEGRILGAVTRQILDAALQHELGVRPVETVMGADLVWVRAEAATDEISRAMLSRYPRFVLVGDEASGRAEGLVTRMGILRHLHGRVVESKLERRHRGQRGEVRPAAGLIEQHLTPELRQRLAAITRVARQVDQPVYLVGGFVRDLLLGRENRDLDVVVEGDGPGFAARLAHELGGRVREHREFLTAVVTLPDASSGGAPGSSPSHIDVATARSEFYRAPAALPEVATSVLRQDLYRRDFTVNTLALRLHPGTEPQTLDYFGGRHDLEAGALRVLHSLSFIDDPTRAFRAVRLEQRLGFHISPETLRLLKVALAEGVFDQLSPARLRDELALLLDEPEAVLRGLARLEELTLLKAIHPDLSLGPAVRERLRQAVTAYDWYRVEGLTRPPARLWCLVLLILADSLREPWQRRAFGARLGLAGATRDLLGRDPGRRFRAGEKLREPASRPHQVREILADFSGEELLWLMTEDEPVRTRVRLDWTAHRHLAPAIRGRDLLARGLPPGPHIGAALRAVSRARLDGEIGPEEELDFALAWLRGHPPEVPPAAIPDASPAGIPEGIPEATPEEIS